MPRFVFDSVVEVAPELLFAWHEQQGAFHRMLPPWSGAEIRRYDGLRLGAQTEIHIPMGPGHLTWLTETREIDQGRSFTDVQVKGPFRHWEHVHLITSVGAKQARLIDHIDLTYARPISWTSGAREAIEKRLSRAFTYRHTIIRNDLQRVRQYTTAQPLRVAISGTSGLLGTALRHLLDAAGHSVFTLVPHPPRTERELHFDYRNEAIDAERLREMDAIVHLAGASMARMRWSEEVRGQIHASRVRSTELLARTLAGLPRRPSVFITAATTGIYGDRPGEVLDEDSPAGEERFLSVLGREWEAAAEPARSAGIRTVHLRFGLLVSPRGPILRRLLEPTVLGLGARMDRSRSALGWISLDDALYAILHALAVHSVQGAVNAVAPESTTPGELLDTLARTSRRPRRMALPERILQPLLGDVAREFLLLDQRVVPHRLLATDFQFAFPDLEGAVRHQFGRADPLPAAND